MSYKPTLKQRWQYAFDNLMAAGTPAMIGTLFALSFVLIMAAAAALSLFGITQDGGETLSLGEAAWESLMRTLDAGTMGGDTGAAFRLVMLGVTLGGVFFVSALIGVLGSGVESKLEELRKGRSLVLEQEHTVILGWSPQIFTILEELIEANANQKRSAIVILADVDKVEMEDEIRSRTPKTRNTRIICRSGSPTDPTDLEIASPHTARAIIVLPPAEEHPDTFVIKTVLAITNHPQRHAKPYNIVTQISDRKNLPVMQMIGRRDHLSTLLVGDIIARVTAQTSRQSGLSVVYTELLGFSGDEIYFKAEPALIGKTFGETLNAYEESTVIGIFAADQRVHLNPPMDTRLAPGDQLIFISADDDTIHLATAAPPIQEALIEADTACAPTTPERNLILGWNEYAAIVVGELDHYVAPGSTLTIVAHDVHETAIHQCRARKHLEVDFHAGDTTDRVLLNTLQIETYDHVIVLADTGLSVQASDARTLITLLHLRDIAEGTGATFSIVSEMLDLRNRALAEIANVDDFIVSDHLISLMLSQLSENPALYAVFTDLFDPAGSEVYLKPITDYVQIGKPVSFATIVEAARRRGQTVLGFRCMAQAYDPTQAYGVHTNPRKSEELRFTADAKIIVLAES